MAPETKRCPGHRKLAAELLAAGAAFVGACPAGRRLRCAATLGKNPRLTSTRTVIRPLCGSGDGGAGALVQGLAEGPRMGHAECMVLRATEPPSIPGARFDDLDLDRDEDRAEWQRRLRELGTARLSAARARLQGLGVIDADGNVVSGELPPDMLPESDTTLETG